MEGNRTYHERKNHGEDAFPFNIYPCSIPYDFNQVPVHWHEEMEVVSVRKGTGVVTVDTIPHVIGAGEAVVIFPGQLHGIGSKEGSTVEYENIIFRLDMLMASGTDVCTDRFLSPLTDSVLPEPLLITQNTDHYEKFSSCIGWMDQCCREREEGYQLAVKGSLFMLLYLISGQISFETAGRTNKSRERMKSLLAYVDLHFGEKITVEDGASICYYSHSHFMKYFRQYMGMSFIEYLNDYRLDKAAEYLLSGEDTVTSVAQRCGYDNLSYFNRQFRHKYGQTPREYRRNHGAG